MNCEEQHRDAIVINMTCPLACMTEYIDWRREGDATLIGPTVTGMSDNVRIGLNEAPTITQHV